MSANSAWQRVEDVATMLAARHTVAVLCALVAGPMSYGSLKRAIPGMADATLSTRLHMLEDHKLVTRTVTLEDRNAAIRYELTKRGAELKPIIADIHEWAVGRPPEPKKKSKKATSD